jgi:FkbM family methyltransferase
MKTLIARLLRDAVRPIYRLVREPQYREYWLLMARLRARRRFAPCTVRAGGYQLEIPDALSFLAGFREIFVHNIYSFKADSSIPNIIDLGANIGLSVLYFKFLYPQAEICALEADPKIFEYLVQNIRNNGFRDVTLLNKAAWNRNAVLKFMPDGADGGRVIPPNGDDRYINVEAIDVSELIAGRSVDLLKIDIEGAEVDVLVRCRDVLSNVRRIFVEYHSKAGQIQNLSLLLDVLESQGFRYHIHSMTSAQKPFLGVSAIAGYDMLLNIFAWRPSV